MGMEQAKMGMQMGMMGPKMAQDWMKMGMAQQQAGMKMGQMFMPKFGAEEQEENWKVAAQGGSLIVE